MEFKYQFDANNPEIILRLKYSDLTLTEALEAFESFLLAAGYNFDGHVEISNELELTKELEDKGPINE